MQIAAHDVPPGHRPERFGSPALGLCNVAAGRTHAYWALDLKIWDLAAGALILHAGRWHPHRRARRFVAIQQGGYIASNSIIHGWTMRCLQTILEEKVPHDLRGH